MVEPLAFLAGATLGMLATMCALLYFAEGSVGECRAANPGYNCVVIVRWERAEAFR